MKDMLEQINSFISILLSYKYAPHIGITIALLSLIALFIILAFAPKAYKAEEFEEEQNETKRLKAIRGKLEKVELSLNNTRAEIFRSLEFIKQKLGSLEERIIALEKGEEFKPLKEEKIREEEKQESKEGVEFEEEKSLLSFQEPEEEKEEEQSPESKLALKLGTPRKGFLGRLKGILGGKKGLDISCIEELEELLISSDFGVKFTDLLIERLKNSFKKRSNVTSLEVKKELERLIVETLSANGASRKELLSSQKPLVVLIVGVNGVGKTTTLAKLSSIWKEKGKVLLVAGDTFRAAAVEQLKKWGDKIEVEVLVGKEGQKPSGVVYDAIKKAVDEQYDFVGIDTAGRLHTRSNLMEELKGIVNAARKVVPSAPHEVLLVVDGTTGQNAVEQAKKFNEVCGLTGVIVTKLDSTAKGGIVVAIKDLLGVPIKYIGVGEKEGDLLPFDPILFVSALFNERASRETTA